ncbi:MAG: hypothetical protein Tsb009_02470 [Planctomycetaceae bacterium]
MSNTHELDILTIFTRQRDLCKQLLECSQSQRPLIQADQYAQLLDVIARKQRLLDEWETMKSKHHPSLSQSWQEQRLKLDSDVRANCERLLKEIETLYEQLLNEEQLSTESLTTRRNQTQAQLREISKGTDVHRAYRDHLAPATHRHLDFGQ